MSQLHLLGERRFWPLFWTQFLGAFNDNLFKNALVIMITFQSATLPHFDGALLVLAIPAASAQTRVSLELVLLADATGSIDAASQIVTTCDIDVLSGDDSLTLPLMSVGATGVISVLGNLIPDKIKAMVDAGTFREVTAIGFDMNVNITERLKGYLRMLNVNEETEARHTLFAQLKYDIGWGAEFYFEYGDAGQSDNLVYTDWFVKEDTGDNLADRFKVLVKAWF